MKDLQKQLDALKEKESDEIELEEKYHDYEQMVAISVMDHEIAWLQNHIATITSKDEKEFGLNKLDALKYQKETLESNIKNKYTTVEQYIK